MISECFGFLVLVKLISLQIHDLWAPNTEVNKLKRPFGIHFNLSLFCGDNGILSLADMLNFTPLTGFDLIYAYIFFFDANQLFLNVRPWSLLTVSIEYYFWHQDYLVSKDSSRQTVVCPSPEEDRIKRATEK